MDRSLIHEIVTNTGVKQSHRVNTYKSWGQSVPSGNSSYKKRKLMGVNIR